MLHRENWVQSTVSAGCHFIWKYNTRGVNYNKLSDINLMISMDKFLFINHFENHTEITNKRRMFANLKQFCDVRNIY